MADRPLIDDSLALLNFCGLITYEDNPWSKLKKICLTIIILIGYIDIVVCTVVNWNEPDSIQRVLSAFGFAQVVLKIGVYKSQYILLILKKMKKFHPLKKDDLAQATNGEIFTKIKFIIKSFIALIIVVLTLFLSKTFLSSEKQLPYGSFLFWSRESPILEIGYLYETAILLMASPVQVGFDIFYIAVITNIVYEFKLLKRDLAQLPISENSESDAHTLEALRDLINHHNVILDCSNALRRAYYYPFLSIFMFNMTGIGFCLVCIIANGFFVNIGITILYGMCAIFYIVQLLLYCAPGTILILELQSTEVSDVIFNTDWWIKTQPQLRKTYVRIIQRANKPILLSAGGMMNVTLETFNKVVKNTLSFFTCVQAMYKKH